MDVLEHIQELKNEIERLKGDRWVSVGGRVPETYQDEYYGRRHSIPVLIYDSYGNPVIVKWDTHSCGWVKADFCDGYRAIDYDFTSTHWQPLPEAPKD